MICMKKSRSYLEGGSNEEQVVYGQNRRKKESKETQQRYSSKSSMSLESWWQAEDIQPTLLLVNEVAR